MNLATILELVRPLAVLDLETTGLTPERDRIVQIGLTIHYPQRDPISWKSCINPEIKIPARTTEVHGIKDSDVAGAPTFKTVGPVLAPKITNVDFLGYNILFDLKFMRSEMKRVGVVWDWEKNKSHVIDALRIYRIKEPRNLEAAFRRFVDKDGFAGAHDAGNDVMATAQVLGGQLLEFTDLPKTIPELAEVCFPKQPDAVDRTGKIAWKGDDACINFGKWAGTPLKTMNAGYLKWMLQGDFPADTKELIEKALIGQFPTKK